VLPLSAVRIHVVALPANDLLAAEARLVADDGAGAALALQAVAHRDARWFALSRKVKLPAAASGVSGGHRSAPCLWAEYRLDFQNDASATADEPVEFLKGVQAGWCGRKRFREAIPDDG
jgi:hypothetical protein